MVIIKREFLDKVIAHSKRELPNEACGILAGPPSCIGQDKENSVRRVNRVYEMTNADKSPETFFMDAKEQLRVIKEIRNSNLEMVGIYHSHVASRAYPSSHDVELALYPDASYIIVSLGKIDNPSVRSFNIRDNKITEEEIRIE